MVTDRPLVSVLTPSFNQGRFLADCIASVQNQTYPHVEHVISDGGSTDETLNILRDAPDTVRWTSGSDAGQANALNKAFARCEGDIIGWINSDDAYFDRAAIEHVVDAMTAAPDLDLVYGHAALVAADNELLHFMWAPPFSGALFRYANFIVQPTVFIRRRALASFLVDDDFHFALDRELWLRLWATGRKFARIDVVVAIDRHHEARKVYTIQEVGELENRRLRATYGLPDGALRPVVSKAFRIAARAWGVRLLGHAHRETAIDVRVPSLRVLARRQLVTPRRLMPPLPSSIDHRR